MDWLYHAKQRAEDRPAGFDLDLELVSARRLGKCAKKTVRRMYPVSAAKYMHGGFVGRYCLISKANITRKKKITGAPQ